MSSDYPNLQENPLHASCVCVGESGLLIIGPSGSGKSSLTLEVMALGASLVADDRCVLSADNGHLFAAPPETIAGRIEARGVGILNADYVPQARIYAVLDMGRIETDRLPESRSQRILGVELPLYYKSETTSLAAAMMQLLKVGRHA